MLLDYAGDTTDVLLEYFKNSLYTVQDEYSKDSHSLVLNWYFDAEEAFEDAAKCKARDSISCDVEDERAELIKRIKTENIPEEEACLWLLGRVAVLSECGDIPEYCVEKLSKISECSCNHMG